MAQRDNPIGTAARLLPHRMDGEGPLRPSGHGEGNLLPASPDLRVNCCSTSSAGRAQHMSR
jgi:hypothetical protein